MLKRLLRSLPPLTLAVGLLATGATPPASAGAAPPTLMSPSDAAFDQAAGRLDVDYQGYLSKHDIVYNRPNTNPVHGLTVGNGRTGAMVWSQNGLTMQVSGVDLSQQSAFAAGLVNLYSNPGMDTGYTTYQQRLNLYDGTLTTKYDSNRTVTIMGSPGSEVMGIHVDDTRGGVSSVALDLSMWDPATVTNSGDVPDLNTWKTISTFADASGAGLSRGQTDANGFGYTLAATVEGAGFTTQVVDGRKVRLNITPTSGYTIWINAASRLNAPGRDSVAAARNQLASVKGTGYATTYTNYRDWWHSFWSRSFVQYSNGSGDADYMENVYYLSTYMIAAGGYGSYPVHFINGVFRATQDATKWSNAYWYWNQRDVYNSFLAANHTDLMDGFNRLYSRNYAALKSYTTTRYGVDGLWVPETMGWDGNARGTVGSDYTKNILSTGYEAAFNMYLRYRYTNDLNYLRDVAYPYMRETAKFYRAMLSFDGATGTYHMANSNSHETYWNVRNAITDLAAVRSIFPLTIQVSQLLGQDAGLRAGWQDVLDHLVAYPTGGGAYLPHQAPISQTRNNENVAAELIWPYNVTGLGYPDYQTAVNTWNARPFPYGNVWSNDAVQAARLGLGDQTYQGMRTMLQKYQNYPNGMTSNTNGVFEYLGVHLSAMNEALMQSYNDKIRVFPAAPGDSSFVGRFTLLAKDGFLVSSEREAGEVKYVGLRSLYGKQATVVNPWSGQQVRVRRASDGSIVTTTSGGEVSFATAANTVYVVERTAKPLGSYSPARLSGTANQNAKTLTGTGSALGIPGQGSGTRTISLRSKANGLFVTAAPGTPLIASRSTAGTGERFERVDLGNGNIALRARINDQYVAAENAGAEPLVANRTAVGPWETFQLVTNPDGSVSLKAQVNGRYVCADGGGAQPLIANRTAIGPWESFDLVSN